MRTSQPLSVMQSRAPVPRPLEVFVPISQLHAEPWDVAEIHGWFGGDLDAYGGFVLFNAYISNLREILHGDRSSLGVWCTLHTKDFNCEKNEDLLKKNIK